MWRSRMFWRLFGTFGVLWLVSIAALGWVIESRIEHHYLEEIEGSLRARVFLVAEVVRAKPTEDVVQLQERIESLRRETGTRITLLASDGTVLADSDKDPRKFEIDNHSSRPEVQDALRTGFGISSQRYSTTVNKEMMYAALRTDDAQGAAAVVRVALPLDAIKSQVAELRRIVWYTAAAAALAGMIIAFWLGRRITRPLQELTAGVARLAAGDHGPRVFAFGKDETGTLARAFNTMSERLAEQFAQLEKDREQLRAVLSGMVEGVIAIDAEQRILFANERAGHLLEFQAGAAVGRKLWEVVRQRPLREVLDCAAAQSECHCEELVWDAPTSKSVAVHVAQLAGSTGRGAVIVLHDTSEVRRLERLRRDFVANVSHELKTPLSVIKACSETLLDGAADDAEHRAGFLQQIAEQAERLHALILDLLSLARIEGGTEAFAFEAVPLGASVAECFERHRPRAEAKSQRLESSPPSEAAPAAVAAWADQEAVGQILDNLVDNAVKYTPAGGRVGIRWWAEDGHACVEVADTGIGIPERDLPRIFERFYRVDKARSRELGGTGLGLSIVKHLVQAMHGSISASSQIGQGTSFTVRLPRAE